MIRQIQHRQVVTERFAAGGGGDDRDVPAGGDLLERFGLVSVKARDAALLQRGAEAGIHLRRDLGECALSGGLMVDGADGRIGILVGGAETRDDGFQRGLGS